MNRPSKNNEIFNSAIEKMKEQKLRVTEQRKDILNFLISEHGPFSIEEIFQKSKSKSYDMVTLYRSLAALEEASIVNQCDFGDGVRRYEIYNQNHHHHHVICRSCGGVENIPECFADKTIKSLIKLGYQKISHRFEVFALCPSCQK